jgi:hypothetical protein
LYDPALRDEAASVVLRIAKRVARSPGEAGNPGVARPGVGDAVVQSWDAAASRGDTDALNALAFFLANVAITRRDDPDLVVAVSATAAKAGPAARNAAPRILMVGILTPFGRELEAIAQAQLNETLNADLAIAQFRAQVRYGRIMVKFGRDVLPWLEQIRDEWKNQAKELGERGNSVAAAIASDMATGYTGLLFFTQTQFGEPKEATCPPRQAPPVARPSAGTRVARGGPLGRAPISPRLAYAERLVVPASHSLENEMVRSKGGGQDGYLSHEPGPSGLSTARGSRTSELRGFTDPNNDGLAWPGRGGLGAAWGVDRYRDWGGYGVNHAMFCLLWRSPGVVAPVSIMPHLEESSNW